jgi:hypothetical protein
LLLVTLWIFFVGEIVLNDEVMIDDSVCSSSKMDSEVMEDTEDNLCPLCLEELDITDKNFKPCQCGYQVIFFFLFFFFVLHHVDDGWMALFSFMSSSSSSSSSSIHTMSHTLCLNNFLILFV